MMLAREIKKAVKLMAEKINRYKNIKPDRIIKLAYKELI